MLRAPLCVFARAEIRREKYNTFKELARSVAFAYQQHRSRLEWSAYATVAGPSLSVYVIIPLAELAAMDEMVSLDRVMADVYGADGLTKLAEFQSCVLQMNTSVLNWIRSEEHTSELQSLMRISYAVFCLKKK